MTAPTIAELRKHRLRRGVSLREAGEWMGVHSSTLGAWESGRHQPTDEKLQEYATALGWQVPQQRRRPPRTVNRGAPAPTTDWQERARCRGTDLRLFFSSDLLLQKRAKDLCRACPVIGECLAWALSWGSAQLGIAGGLTEEERHGYRRNLNRQAQREES